MLHLGCGSALIHVGLKPYSAAFHHSRSHYIGQASGIYFTHLPGTSMQVGVAVIFESKLEAKVVAPVAAAVLGLRRNTVFWQRGLLSSPIVNLWHANLPVLWLQ